MIGEKIAEIRKQRGYSLTELAELANISKSYLSNIERNLNKNPSLKVVIKIAKVLKVDLLTLLKNGSDFETHIYIEKEWVEFVNELKEMGVEKEQLEQYKTLIEFIRWKNQQPE
ncbi:helix-turn-helix transcriptional regulator [Neobacillus sp. YIM B02564]|jgi:XRE family transcriptional regulator of biofilm formation|uniref:Helix-turn-helix transcriptional regulator n=1 Tax=Neobacillus paridis TaxID=2803862 RepID=A0ABS1TT57_9BACI|nr:helix-turn-helix transcriptional regulator [Neobacillus paridis]MBL4954452.1 helix-turn-helix transcriptional regulator [Neobacillus paridis]